MLIDDNSFGRCFFEEFVRSVDAVFYLPKYEVAFDPTDLTEHDLRADWYLPFAVTRVMST